MSAGDDGGLDPALALAGLGGLVAVGGCSGPDVSLTIPTATEICLTACAGVGRPSSTRPSGDSRGQGLYANGTHSVPMPSRREQ